MKSAVVSGSIDPGLLAGWLATLPAEATTDESLAVLGHLAGRIAERRGCQHPSALDPAEHPAARSAPEAILAPDLLGPAWEAMMASIGRRARGSHFTGRPIADEVCGHAFDQAELESAPTVWDPAVGGGAFLLAAARQVESALELNRADIVSRLYGSDIDRVAVLVADAAVELWSNGAGRPRVDRLDALVDDLRDRPDGGFDLVVGNPPFLGQLATDTARSTARRTALGERFGAAASGYVDDAGLFLLLGLEHAAPGGVVSMIVPQSLLGAVGAEQLRRALESDAELRGIWVGDSDSFSASVDVAAPVLRRSRSKQRSGKIDVWRRGSTVRVQRPDAQSWGGALANSLGVPSIRLRGVGRLGDQALVTSGFRQHFYGLAGAVREGERENSRYPLLVTAGAIDPLCVRWGRADVRFAGSRWSRPVVDIEAIDDARVAKWFRERCRPKVLVATQTRVVETIADPDGRYLPSVPVITVEPVDNDRVWHIAAMLSAPAVSAALAESAAGTGLSAGSFRVRAKELAALPLPSDVAAWDEGADLARLAQDSASDGDWSGYRESMKSLGSAMDRAFNIEGDSVSNWWLALLPTKLRG